MRLSVTNAPGLAFPDEPPPFKNGVNGKGGDGINTSGPFTITQNIVNGNAGHGIEAGVSAIDGGHNFAKDNKTPPSALASSVSETEARVRVRAVRTRT